MCNFSKVSIVVATMSKLEFKPLEEIGTAATDGEPCPGTMPKSDLKGTNVIWLVYSNRNFSPCCGKVIQINKHELDLLKNDEFSID